MLYAVANDAFFHPYDQIAPLFDRLSSLSVEHFLLLIVVSGTIDLNDESRRMTQKIDNESGKRRLPSEAPFVEVLAAQAFPKRLLGDTLCLP